MAIIVEMKDCCRKHKLDEGPIDFTVDFVVKLLDSDTGFAGEARSRIVEGIAGKIFEYLFGGFSEGTKKTILYKTILKSLAALDAEDYVALFRGGAGKSSVCQKLAGTTITGLLKVINNEIIGELETISKQFTGAEKSPFGTMFTGVLGSVATFVSGSMIEDLKTQGKLEPLADAICKINFMDLLKRQFGDMDDFLKGLKNPFDE